MTVLKEKRTDKKEQELQNQSGGFTLVELLVVIFIIGILATLLVTNFVGVRSRAGDASKKSDVNQLKTALRLYYNDYQQYPLGSGGRLMGCGQTADIACSAGSAFVAGSGNTLYMKELPTDFSYYSDGGDTFVITTTLENLSDEGLESSQTTCDPESRSYFTTSLADDMFIVCES